jgi:PAS domain S-box-containing protein
MTLAPTAWLGFVVWYTGAARLRSWRLTALLAFEPLLVLGLAATNVHHGLIWQSIAYTGGDGNGIVSVDGAAIGFVVAYAYGAGAVGLAGLGWKLRTSGRLGWRQVGGLAIATLITAIVQSGVLDGLAGSGISTVPYGMCCSGIALYWSLLHYRLLELGAIAHDAAFDSMSDGIIVVDLFGNVAEINSMAASIVGQPRSATLGSPLAQLVSDDAFRPLREILGLDTGLVELELTTADGPQHYEVQIQPLRHGRQRLPSRLITLRNVTGRRLADAALRQSEERFRLQYRDSPIPTYS